MNKLLIWSLLIFCISPTLLAQEATSGESFLEKGTAAQDSEYRDSAVYFFKKAQDFYREKADWQKFLEASAGLGRNYLRMDDYALVEENALAAFDIHEKYNQPDDDINYLELLNQMGRINWWIKGDFEAAFSYLHRARKLAVGLDEPNKMLRPVYTDLGYTHAYDGDFDSAVYYYESALKIAIELHGDKSAQTADRYTDLAIAFIQKSAWEKAEVMQKRAIELNIETRGEDHIATLKCYNNLGFIYLEKYDNDQAIFYLNKGIDLIKKKFGPKHRSVGIGYMNLGAAYHNKGDDANSVKYSLMARENYKSSLGEESPFMAIVLVNLGTGYSALNQVDSALYYFNKGLELNQKLYGDMHQEMVSYYAYMNDFYITHGFYTEAEEGINTSIEVADQVMPEKHLFTARNHYQLAQVLAATDRVPQALKQCQIALTRVIMDYNDLEIGSTPGVTGETVSRRKLLEILTLKTQLLLEEYEATDNSELLNYASETAAVTDKTIDMLRAEYQTPESKEILLTRTKSFYEDAIKIAFLQFKEADDPSFLEDAFAFMEKSKSVLLFERIQSQTESLEAVLPDSLANQEKSLARNIATYEEELFNARAGNDTIGLEPLEKKLFETKRSHDFLLGRIKTEYPDYFEIRYEAFNTSLDKAQKAIPENTLLINYFIGEKDIYILGLTRDQVHYEIIADEDQLANRVNQLLSGVRNKAYDAQLANEIYKLILEPILDKSEPTINMLAIVPDDILHYLPFEILQRNNNEKNAYLLRDFTIRYLHSATISERSAGAKPQKSNYLGFSPSYSLESNPLLASRSAADNRLGSELEKLPMAAEEIRQSAKIWSGQYFTESDATESAFKQNASNAGIIHIASHAIIDDENPMNSRLIFSASADSTEDGLLHTYELYNLNLNADLACLSACNTGFGQVKSGEGMVSLAKGFYYAGVSSIMMSLWAVPDNSTSEIIQMFNEEMEKGAGKAEALRMAKLRYLEEADVYSSEPYHWAAFTLIGDNEPVNTGKRTTPWVIGGGFLLVAFIGFFFYQRNKKLA